MSRRFTALVCALSWGLCCVLTLSAKNDFASAFTDGAYISTSDFHSILGDTLSVVCYDASFGAPEYRELTFDYIGSSSVSGSTSLDIPDGWPCLVYAAYAPNLVNQAGTIAIDLSPYFTVEDTHIFHGFIGAGGQTSSWQTAVPPFQSPQWRVHVSGSASTFEHSADSSGVLDSVRLFSSSSGSWFHTVNADIVQTGAFDFSSIRATFNDVRSNSGNVSIIIGCPYISQDADIITGTLGTTTATESTATTSGGGGGIIIDGIITAITGLIDSIIALFVPSVDVIEEWFESVGEFISGLWPDFDLIAYESEIYSIFDSSAGSAVLHLPEISFPVNGSTITIFEERDFNIFSNNFTLRFGDTSMTVQVFIKTIFNWIFTAMFISTVLNKFRSIFAGGEVYITSVKGDRAW